VFSGGLCDELITRPEESYRLWCVVVCDHETFANEEALAHWELSRQKQNKTKTLWKQDTTGRFINTVNNVGVQCNVLQNKDTFVYKF
jgi:hypothetical protein